MAVKTAPQDVSIHPFIFIIIGAVISVASFIIDQSVESSFLLFMIFGIIMSLYGVGKFVLNKENYHPQTPLTHSPHPNNHTRQAHNSQVSNNSHHTQNQVHHNKVSAQHYRNTHQTQNTGYQTSNQPMNFCPKCGARAGHANFCPNCGFKLR